MSIPANDTGELLRRAAEGDHPSLDMLFTRHRARLRRMVELRIDPRVRGRVDASDVLQEASLEAFRRLEEYLRDPKMPFFLWLRFLTSQRVLALHRHHLGAQRRDARREVRLHRGPWPQATTAALADQLMGKQTTPTEAAVRAELQLRVQEALNGLDPIDSEILILRHFEQLTSAEAALELGIEKAAARKRFFRALKRFKGIMGEPS